MSFFEIVILVFIGYYSLAGFKSGFIRTIGGFFGLLIGIFFASRYFEVIAPSWQWIFFNNLLVAKVVIFIFLFIIAEKLFKFAMYLLDRVFNLLRFIPFTKFINKVAGGVFGFLEGALIVGLFIYTLVRFPFSQSLLMAVEQSIFARQLLKFVEILTPLLPDTLEKMKVLVQI
jgi:membrane protein required for colicin V production